MNETSWHSYPKVYALGHREVLNLFSTSVIVQEKIDGSQISFGLINGELKIRSRSVELNIDEPEKMFKKAVDYIISIKEILTPEWTYRGEYLSKPNHNALCYDRIPNNFIILFDINDGHESYLEYSKMVEEGNRLGLETVPLLIEGMILEPSSLTDMINHVSYLGGNHMEGIVVKNYSLFGSDKKVLMAKYVSEKFKEVHKKAWKVSNPHKNDVLALLIDSLRTQARWHKAVQHLKEKGNYDGSPKDIGNLMREIDEDIKSECMDYISEKLTAWAVPHILRGIKKGLPEWYKQHLIDEAYGSKNE